MRILLLSPPYVPEYMRNARCDFVSLSATQWYPILLGYCGAHLEGQGHEVKLVDAPAQYLNRDETRRIALEYRPDLIVLYTGAKSESSDLEFGDSLVEELRCEAVIVGPYASIDPEGALSRARVLDKLVAGEFEHPVGELAAGRRPAEIRNLVYKNGGAIARNAERSCLTGSDLDAIPFVSRFFRDHADIRRYKTPSEFHPFMDIMTGRGCRWGHCTFCLWVHTYVKGATYNLRSISNVMEEFRFIEREMPEIRSVMIQDDTFTEERAREFCGAKLAENIRLPWSCYARGNMSYEVLALMKRAGCRNLHVGFESGDPGILKRIKKGITKERMTQFAADAKRAGLRIHGDFAIGFPGETRATARETVEWARAIRPHTAQFQLMIPFPGTPFFQELERNGWLKNGAPNYPDMPAEELERAAKRAYRRFYISLPYLKQVMANPRELLFGRARTYARAIPAVFWKRWKVRG